MRLSVLLLALLMATGAMAGKKSAVKDGLFVEFPPVWTSYDTKPRACHQGVIDASGRMILLGVETPGDLRSVEARQAIVLIANERGFWTDPCRISSEGIVYFPSMALDAQSRVWIAWSDFEKDRWSIRVRTWDRGKPGATQEVSNGAIVNLQPSIAVLPSGEVYVAWAAGENGRFEIRGRSWKNGAWGKVETVSRGGTQEFRPALAVTTDGLLWVAWDRAAGDRYQTFLI